MLHLPRSKLKGHLRLNRQGYSITIEPITERTMTIYARLEEKIEEIEKQCL